MVGLGFVFWKSSQLSVVVHHWLDLRFCRRCAYDLRGCKVAEDGRRVCPECGMVTHVPSDQAEP